MDWVTCDGSIFSKTRGSADAVNVFIEAESVSRATEKRACVTSVLVRLGTFFESRLAKNRWPDKRRDASRVCQPFHVRRVFAFVKERYGIEGGRGGSSDCYNIKSIYVFFSFWSNVTSKA